MEEQRIGMMYWNALRRSLGRKWDALFPRGLRRSAALPILIVAALLILPTVGYYLHTHGRFAIAKRQIGVDAPIAPPDVARPGGAEAVVLSRAATLGSNMPEFLSATLLPGLGMDVLQITATLPDRGEVPLLIGPTVQQIVDNQLEPRGGINDNHGALELPWSGTISGLISPIGTSLSTVWKGHTLSMPRDPQERPGLAEGGLLNTQGADETRQPTVPNGSMVTGEFKNTDFDGHWPSRSDITVSAQLEPRTLDLTVTVKNTGGDPEPMGIGWHPRFTIPSGNRQAAELRLPMGERLEISDKARGIPSSRIVPNGPALARYQGHAVALGNEDVDETLVNLKPALMDSGSSAEYRDPASGYGLRLTAVSSNIRALRVVAPTGSRYVSLGMQTNYDDALGKQWTGEDSSGLVTLLPGQTIEWKVRLEIFSVAKR